MEAKNKTRGKKEKFDTFRVAAIGASHGIHDTYTAFIAPLLPVFIQNLLLTKAEAGLLTVFVRAPSVIQPLIGHLADRYHLHHLVIFTPAGGAILMSTAPVITSFTFLIVLLLIAGINSAALHAVGPVITGRLSGKSLGKGMSVWMVGGEMGRTLGPIVVVTALAHLTVKGLPWLMIGGITATVFLFIKLKDVHIHHSHIQESLPWRKALKKMGPLIFPLSMIIIGRGFVQASLTTFLPIFLTEQGNSLWMAGVSLTILQGAGVIGAFVSGSLSDRFGRKVLLYISFIGAPLLLLVFIWTQGWLRFILLPVLGFITISVTPVVMAMVQENYPENRALANGIYMFLSFVLRSGVIVVVGVLGDRFGLLNSYIIGSILMLGCLPFIFLLPKDK